MKAIRKEKIKKEKIRENRIDNVFAKLRSKGKKALIPFITCGYPSIDDFMKLFDILEKNGADIIEIGIPFSDPLADGPVIQATSKIALENGINTDTIMDIIVKIRSKSSIPIVFLTYFNTVYRYGINKFLKRASDAGVDGLIIADLPLEEFYNYGQFFNDSSIDKIMLASLTSSKDRLYKISSLCKGFLYCVAVKGVTGIRDGISSEVKDFLVKLRSITNLPLALGFGISNPGQINEVKKYCDAIIIGSKILSLLLDADDFNKGLSKVEEFMIEVNTVLK